MLLSIITGAENIFQTISKMFTHLIGTIPSKAFLFCSRLDINKIKLQAPAPPNIVLDLRAAS